VNVTRFRRKGLKSARDATAALPVAQPSASCGWLRETRAGPTQALQHYVWLPAAHDKAPRFRRHEVWLFPQVALGQLKGRELVRVGSPDLSHLFDRQFLQVVLTYWRL
jgi:hypothetical protein